MTKKKTSKVDQIKEELLKIEEGTRVRLGGRWSSPQLRPLLDLASSSTVRKALQQLSDVGAGDQFEESGHSNRLSWTRTTEARRRQLTRLRAKSVEREALVESLKSHGIRAGDHGRRIKISQQDAERFLALLDQERRNA